MLQLDSVPCKLYLAIGKSVYLINSSINRNRFPRLELRNKLTIRQKWHIIWIIPSGGSNKATCWEFKHNGIYSNCH